VALRTGLAAGVPLSDYAFTCTPTLQDAIRAPIQRSPHGDWGSAFPSLHRSAPGDTGTWTPSAPNGVVAPLPHSDRSRCPNASHRPANQLL